MVHFEQFDGCFVDGDPVLLVSFGCFFFDFGFGVRVGVLDEDGFVV